MFLDEAIIPWGLRVPTPPARGSVVNPLQPHQQGLCSPAPATGWCVSGTAKQVLAPCVTHVVRKRKIACDAKSHRTTPVLPRAYPVS
jgi:hypothetical protein